MYTLVKGLFLGVGQYPMDVDVKDRDGATIGTYKPAFIDLYSPESGQVRYSLDRSFAITDPVVAERAGISLSGLPDGLAMGEFVACEGTSANAEKLVRGDRDRSVKSVKVTIRSVQRQGDPLIGARSEHEALTAA